MKMRVYLSLGALLLFLTPLGCSGKAENPAPETPPEEQPKPGPEEPKPEFVDANRSMEETMHFEDDECFYTYFRMQNATKHSVVFFITTRISSYSGVARINPGEQATWLQTMTYLPWIDDNDMVIKDLKALAFVELFFDPPHSSERWVDDELDPCARYSFFDPMTETQRGTPRDQSAWVLEEFPDRPNAVRWTYRITEGEYEEAVRQTLERWADRDEEEKECV